MTETQEALLAREINKLKHIACNPKERLTIDAFMNAVMRGGLNEIIAHNGGKRLCFGIRDATGDQITLQDYYIPKNETVEGDSRGSFRGFLLTANDGTQTVDLRSNAGSIKMEMELLGFFNSLYKVIAMIHQAGNEIHVYLEDIPAIVEPVVEPAITSSPTPKV